MTEQEQINRLLAPRYKVIALWPNTDYDIGNIIYDPSPKKQKEFFDLYPHLFKPLHWWEDRKHSDLPNYIKWVSPGSEEIYFFKVNNWYTSPNTSEIAGVEVNAGRMFIKDCWPATEQEYNDYIKSKS